MKEIVVNQFKDDNQTLLVAIMAVLFFGASIMVLMDMKSKEEITITEFDIDEIFIADPDNYDYTQDIEISEPLPEIPFEDHGGLPEILPPLTEETY